MLEILSIGKKWVWMILSILARKFHMDQEWEIVRVASPSPLNVKTNPGVFRMIRGGRIV